MNEHEKGACALVFEPVTLCKANVPADPSCIPSPQGLYVNETQFNVAANMSNRSIICDPSSIKKEAAKQR